jgi:predicted phosphohydrolase
LWDYRLDDIVVFGVHLYIDKAEKERTLEQEKNKKALEEQKQLQKEKEIARLQARIRKLQ